MTKGSMPVSSNLACFLFNFRGIVFSGRSYLDAIQGRLSNSVPTVQVPFCPQIVFVCGKEQAFSEVSGSAQEVIFSILYQAVYQCGLVHIAVACFMEVFKILYAYGVFHNLCW